MRWEEVEHVRTAAAQDPSFSLLDVQFDPYIPSETQERLLRNAFRNDERTLPCYHMRDTVMDNARSLIPLG